MTYEMMNMAQLDAVSGGTNGEYKELREKRTARLSLRLKISATKMKKSLRLRSEGFFQLGMRN